MLPTSTAPRRAGTRIRAIATLSLVMLIAAAAAIAPARADGHHGRYEHGWRGREWHGGYYGHRHYWQGYPPYFYAPPPVIYFPPPPVVYPPPPPVVYLPPPSFNFVFSWQHR